MTRDSNGYLIFTDSPATTMMRHNTKVKISISFLFEFDWHFSCLRFLFVNLQKMCFFFCLLEGKQIKQISILFFEKLRPLFQRSTTDARIVAIFVFFILFLLSIYFLFNLYYTYTFVYFFFEFFPQNSAVILQN